MPTCDDRVLERPRRGAGEDAWREFAVELQRRLGEANRRAVDEVRAAVERAHEHVERVEAASAARTAELRKLRRDHERLLHARMLLGRKFDALARMLLDEGDVPAAIDVLARRRQRIAAARGGVRS